MITGALTLVRALPAVWMWVALAALVAAAAGTGFVSGIRSEADRHAEYDKELTAENAKLEAENVRIKRESKRINVETAAGWAVAVDRQRRAPAVRLRWADCSPATLRAIPGSTGSPEPAAVERGPGPGRDAPQEIPVEQCESRLNRAVEDAAQVMWLLDWAAAQREASTP